MALIDNLIAYYKLDENAANTTVSDSHTNNLSGNCSDNTSNRSSAGIINTSFQFENDARVTLVDDDGFSQGASGYSVSFWIYAHQNQNGQGIIAKDLSTGRERLVLLNTGLIQYYSFEWSVSVPLVSGAWHHVVFAVPNATGGINAVKAYLDGVDTETTKIGTYSGYRANTNTPLQFATHYNNANEFDGHLDEIGIWYGKVLSQAEVTSLYNSGNGLTYPFTAPAAGNSQMMGANF